MERIEIQHISKSYGATQALKKVSFDLNSGKITGLLGPNGAGKTSLIRILNQIIQQDEGKISIDGKMMLPEDNVKVGYLPEERGLYRSETVKSQLVYFARLKGLTKSEAIQNTQKWLSAFDIQDWADKKVEALSKGMAQKIQFIAAVIHDPEWIILDEPFSGFDPLNVELITGFLNDFKKQDKVVMISTHNMNSAEELCDEIVLLNKGEVMLSDSIENIQKEFAEEMHKISFEGNMIAFANALWTGYELVDKQSFSDQKHTAYLKMKHGNDLTALVKTMEGQVKVEAVQRHVPSMHEIFIRVVNSEKETL